MTKKPRVPGDLGKKGAGPGSRQPPTGRSPGGDGAHGDIENGEETDAFEEPDSTDTVGDTEGWDTIDLAVEQAKSRVATVEATLILIAHPEDKLLGKRYRISPGESVRIGRSLQADLSFPEMRSISRVHAELRHHGSRVTIEDMGSKNHTYVNDQRIDRASNLTSGDRFQVGNLHFKFLHELDVENAYHKAIYDLGQRDGLTEIYNRRKFDEEFERECYRASQFARPVTLVIFDLDHLKPINDKLGHLAGDFVLKRLAAVVRRELRPEQIFGRVGGDEFGILLPETTVSDGEALAERLRKRICEEPFETEEGRVPVTCSFGVAHFEPPMRSYRDLYKATDSALYRSKAEGRNRVYVFGQTPASE